MKQEKQWYRFNVRGVKVGFFRWTTLGFSHRREFYRDYTQGQPSWHWSLRILGFGICIVMPPKGEAQ